MTERLLRWFSRAKRRLPWREARSPYRVWVSETMLQQTQVATVIPYFEHWMKRFPTVQALADAPLDDILKAWEGLGYYRRARNLHRAAQSVAEGGGVFPETYGGWLELPGIGPYTAAAVSSIVNGEPVVAVDGNVRRVAARLFAFEAVTDREARALLTPFINEEHPGDFNEALMELGATVCTPRAPQCGHCPLTSNCKAYALGRVQDFPAPKVKKKIPHHHRYAHVYFEDGALWLRQRSTDEMLGGLWGFVLSDEQPEGEALEPVQHAYTHFRISVTPILVSSEPADGQPIQWDALPNYALSTLDHKILARIETNRSLVIGS